MDFRQESIRKLVTLLNASDFTNISENKAAVIYETVAEERFWMISCYSNAHKFKHLLANLDNLLPAVKEKFTRALTKKARAESVLSAETSFTADLDDTAGGIDGTGENEIMETGFENKPRLLFSEFIRKEDILDRFFTIMAGIVSLFMDI